MLFQHVCWQVSVSPDLQSKFIPTPALYCTGVSSLNPGLLQSFVLFCPYVSVFGGPFVTTEPHW